MASQFRPWNASNAHAIWPWFTQDMVNRFMSKFTIGGGCWVWTAAKLRSGYGLTGIRPPRPARPVTLLAHRVSFALHSGSNPGRVVMHLCDNPSCVRPCHLASGTNAENRADSVSKGRHARGESHGAARLCDGDVRKIRELCGSGTHQRDVARAFSVGQATISRIVTGTTWRHVK